MENKFKRYEFEGIIIDIPLMYNEAVNRYLEEFPDFVENPVYTAKGMPLTLCFEDVCKSAEPKDDDALIECSDCIFFQRAAEKALLGFCKCKNNIKA